MKKEVKKKNSPRSPFLQGPQHNPGSERECGEFTVELCRD